MSVFLSDDNTNAKEDFNAEMALTSAYRSQNPVG